MVEVLSGPSSDDRRPVVTVSHTCAVCGHEFPYRYSGLYRDDALQPIDFICRACLPAWYARWAVAHGWSPGPENLEVAQ